MSPASRYDARRVVALLPRTSDVGDASMLGARALGERLGARIVGSPGAGRRAAFDDDLAEAHGVLLEAGGQIDDAFEDGQIPILLAGTCSIAVATLPVVVARNPDAWVLWMDAHADFNTPETTRSGRLGGMCLSGACGLWDTGFGAGVDPARVVMYGVRDVDAAERALLDTRGVGMVERRAELADALDGRPVFVHLDLDVLDPRVLDADVPVPGGLDMQGLRSVLDLVAGAADVIGAEIVAARADRAELLAQVIDPLL